MGADVATREYMPKRYSVEKMYVLVNVIKLYNSLISFSSLLWHAKRWQDPVLGGGAGHLVFW